MLKFKVVREKNGPLIVFGLSKMNIQKLQEGHPMKFSLADIGMSGEVFIFTGDTEASMMKELEDGGLLPASKASTKTTN
jgi:hypothetical protein